MLLIASSVLAVGIVLSGVVSAYDEYQDSESKWEILEDGTTRPLNKKIHNN